ncbi:unnamed protein product (mitochondrion) [Plasmodiophora brassicae]|uniref:Xaa-Pro dipeptidyl-peptidase C-terminal domain-containing protein n=1 Tax=Plasmodiophora brassicae TaxID=37360 RepID=A0A3P3Y1V1_PLABS|nr:unnamed protein product [Plasmodiophora brassicae]
MLETAGSVFGVASPLLVILVVASFAVYYQRRNSRHRQQCNPSKPKKISWFLRFLDHAWCWYSGEAISILPVPVCYIDQETVPLDGEDAVLVHTRYFPEGAQDLALPCILIRTPYGREFLALSAARFASRGYCVIAQDCRGRSQGSTGDEFIPQPFCSGSIGMFGMSYLGICQWAVVDHAPASLKAIVPVNTASDVYSVLFPSSGGSVRIDLIVRWIYLVFVVRERDVSVARRLYRRLRLASVTKTVSLHMPTKEIDRRLVGRDLSFFKGAVTYLDDRSHPFWKEMNIDGICRHRALSPPALLIAGWFDMFLQSQLRDWQALQASSKSSHSLTIGPWHHWQVTSMAKVVESQALDWLDSHLKEGGNGRLPWRHRVRVYVGGIDDWIGLEEFPPAQFSPIRYFLNGNCLLSTEPEPTSLFVSYVYDPLHDPTPACGGASFDPNNAGSKRQTQFERRSDVVMFTSRAMDGPVAIIGLVSATLFVESDAKSSDWVARLCYVDKSGVSRNLCDGISRVPSSPLPSSAVHRVEIGMWATAHVLKAGERIRLQVCSGAHPRFSRNSGSGKCFDANSRSYHRALQRVHLSPEFQSCVVLPICPYNALLTS